MSAAAATSHRREDTAEGEERREEGEARWQGEGCEQPQVGGRTAEGGGRRERREGKVKGVKGC